MGLFLQQFYKQDKIGLFAYICNKLANNNTYNIILLSEVIAKKNGCEAIDNFGKKQQQGQTEQPR